MLINPLSLTKKQRAVALAVIAVGALLYLWFIKPDVHETKHITAVVEQHKQEVKHIEKHIIEIRKETDANIPKAESLDIDPLVDWFNGWLGRID